MVQDMENLSDAEREQSLRVGVELLSHQRSSLLVDSRLARISGYNFMCAPILTNIASKESSDDWSLGSFYLSQLDDRPMDLIGRLVSHRSWTANTVEERQKALKLLKGEVSWANHIGITAVLFPTVRSEEDVDLFCQAVNEALQLCTFTQVLVRLPILLAKQNKPSNMFDPWEWWYTIRTACGNSDRLGLVLDVTDSYPPEEKDYIRWMGEPVRIICFDTSIFLSNAKGYPVLSRAMQAFTRKFMKFTHTSWMIRGDQSLSCSQGQDAYVQYLQHVLSSLPQLSVVDQFAKGYEDLLQTPLQPLMDNLDSQTYETFMKDPVKYQLYETAIFSYFTDRLWLDHKLGIDRVKHNHLWVWLVYVVGAGSRGPLVDCCFKAAKKAGCLSRIRVIAVEKNPNAMITLRQQSISNPLWLEHKQVFEQSGAEGLSVAFVHDDMRAVGSGYGKGDLIVSELLGSFGDNELSPECLDTACSLLLKSQEDDEFGRSGVSIPMNSTSFVQPISSLKLYKEVSRRSNVDGIPKCFEIPYVVKLHEVNDGVAPVQALWEFAHPNSPINASHDRFKKVRFQVMENLQGNKAIEVHGFAGYFESILYDSSAALMHPKLLKKDHDEAIKLSIVPETHSPGMFSWFPLYIPLQHPIFLHVNDTISFNMWRKTDFQSHKVWYEWSVKVHVANKRSASHISPIYNLLGRSYWIGL